MGFGGAGHYGIVSGEERIAYSGEKIVEVSRLDYQTTEAEKREDMRTKLGFESLTKAVLSEFALPQMDEPPVSKRK